jgi:hypothetical protein
MLSHGARLQEWIVASANKTGAQTVRDVTARELAVKSELFEYGKITTETKENSFIRRLNTLAHAGSQAWAAKVPASLEDAIRANAQEAKPEAELVLFGHWLLLDGRPGLKKTAGPEPDYKEIMTCVAACLYGLKSRERRERNEDKLAHAASTRAVNRSSRPRPNSRKQDITKHDLRDWWAKMFDESRNVSDFDAKLKSMRRLLPAYLSHLKSGTVTHGSKTVTKSPKISAVLAAISGKVDAQPARRQTQLAPIPATPAPFSIPLSYSSSSEKTEYCGPSGSDIVDATLQYRCSAPSPTSQSGKVRPDRKGRLVLAPDVTIRGHYKIEALIDRIAILVDTRCQVHWEDLKKTIEKTTGITVYVRDLTHPQKDKFTWGAALPVPDATRRSGFHFAILIQTPTPDLLRKILTTVRDYSGIIGDVTFHMIEVSVDFYPKTDEPEQCILLRERMVGLLQRHHWVRHSLLVRPEVETPSDIDARQQFSDRTKPGTKTRYLFPHTKPGATMPDHMIEDQKVRDRILTETPGEVLHLNSTVSKGAKNASAHVTIQHKIADQRNHVSGTKTVLPDDERRARVEVTLSGSETLKERDLDTINDLGGISFRKLAGPFLSFRLGTVEAWQHLLGDAEAQMRTRGVYGLELRERVRALEEREGQRNAGEKPTRNSDREGQGLDAWQEMNVVTGKALDELERRWRGFSWI